MAQFAGGRLRVTIRKRNGDRIQSSKYVDYTVYDNTAAPRVIMNDRGNATSNDQPEDFAFLIHGSIGEYLTVDFFHTAAVTLATANCVVSFPYEAYYKNPQTGQLMVDTSRQLVISNRIILSGSTAQNDPRGINDNKVTVANTDTACIAFAPAGQGENVLIKGFLTLYIDGA